MYLEIHPTNPEPRKIKQAADIIRSGGIIIYPTDTVYGLGCDILHQGAVENICRIKRLDPEKAMFTLICKDISQVAEYAWQIDNDVFRVLRKNLPGPFTFILKSANSVPKLFKNRKRTIGIRIPDNKIALALVEEMGRPLLSTSLKMETDDDFDVYLTDPIDLKEHYDKIADVIIDGGLGGNEPSTLVNCVDDGIEIIRQGIGELAM
ncbi:MAG: threonylcarbamoyl-AMP synthase [Saprospiraceae bacterium]|nr:threonylcarbamoyl-AMP synthase [Saprospiraceae bacterium]